MSKEIKSFTYSDPQGLKIGDEVFLGDVEQATYNYCTQCKFEEDEDCAEGFVGKLIFDKPCDKHKYE